jgi:hypothetical protein
MTQAGLLSQGFEVQLGQAIHELTRSNTKMARRSAVTNAGCISTNPQGNVSAHLFPPGFQSSPERCE